MYDHNNVFGKIIAGIVPAAKLFEDGMILAIKDSNPVAPVHILVIPKKPYIDFADFVTNAKTEEIAHYYKIIRQITQEQNIDEYRLISNKGSDVGQTVFHFHTHIIGGTRITGLI